jgi:lysophospholipase L1-like esterase
MQPYKKTSIIFFGDSITQAGAESSGYINLLRQMVNDTIEQNNYELIGAGINGNKIDDLYRRMDRDVIARKPDMVVIYIGINDVWHKTSGNGTPIAKFAELYESIIKKFQANNIDVAVCTTSVIGEKKVNGNPQDTDLDSYSSVILGLSATMNCLLVNLRSAFKKYLANNNPDNQEFGILTTDQVHLNERGNKLVATEMLKVVIAR